MKMNKEKNIADGYEWNEIPSGEQLWDELEKRIFINFTKKPIKIGFGHNLRRIEMIAIGEAESVNNEVQALVGEIVEEEE